MAPPSKTVNKVTLNEVEEKLKAMRQKRLSRLSTFVTEQSKLSEARRSDENSTKMTAIEESSHDQEEVHQVKIPKPPPPRRPTSPKTKRPNCKPPSPPSTPRSVKKSPAPPRPSSPKSVLPRPSSPKLVPSRSSSPKPLLPRPSTPKSAPRPSSWDSRTPPNKEEKILRKLQRNWATIEEVLANDSPVDTDEMEDLRHSLSEAEEFFRQYRAKIGDLELRKTPEVAIERRVETIKKDVEDFRGLKRDDLYAAIKGKLIECLLLCERSKVDRVTALKGLESLLEDKVRNNEKILMEVLEEQVEDIHKRYKHSLDLSAT